MTHTGCEHIDHEGVSLSLSLLSLTQAMLVAPSQGGHAPLTPRDGWFPISAGLCAYLRRQGGDVALSPSQPALCPQTGVCGFMTPVGCPSVMAVWVSVPLWYPSLLSVIDPSLGYQGGLRPPRPPVIIGLCDRYQTVT